MIFTSLFSNKHNLFWTIAHTGLAIISTSNPFVLIVWFYFVLLSNYKKSLDSLKQNKPGYFFLVISYLISFELLDRMTGTSPYVPYELGKYLLFIIGILGIGFFGIRSKTGILMALLITPSAFYDFSGKSTVLDLTNYFLGPFSIGMGIAFSNKLSITSSQLNQILKLIWLTCLSSLVFTIIKTPELDEVEFVLGAIAETTAGHSSNQVSTILGLGMFLSFYSIFNRLNYSGNRILDIFILLSFTFQGLISFSRGGMIVGAIGMIILMFFPEINVKQKSNNRSYLISIISIAVLIFAFKIVNNITDGNLLLRYKGETQGTLLGNKELTADQFVTGRLGIFEKDISLWFDNFFTGVGIGASRFLRDTGRTGVAPHIELSRLLAEHGIFGLFYSIIFFLIIPINSWRRNSLSKSRNILIIILLIAIMTTFHAAMRTYVTPLFVIIGNLKISQNKFNRNSN